MRWSAPTLGVEEHRQELIERRKRMAGEESNPALTYLDKQLARPAGPWLYSSGGRGLRSGELVKQAD